MKQLLKNSDKTFIHILESSHLFEKTLEFYKSEDKYHVRSFINVKNSTSTELIFWNSFEDFDSAFLCFKNNQLK